MPPKNTGKDLISGRPGHRPMPVRRKMSLKAIGRKKICFHLDQLVYLAKENDGTYSFSCRLVEPAASILGTGVMCSEMEIGFEAQVQAEEAALAHLQIFHAAMGGQHRNSKGRRAAYRQRKIDEQTTRRTEQNDELEFFD